MVASAQIILFVEMMKFSKITFLNEMFFEGKWRTFDNIKSIFWLMVVQTTSYWLMKAYQQFNNNFYSYHYKLVWVPFLMNNWSKKKLGVVTSSEQSAMSKFQSCMAVKPISTLSKLYIHSTRDYSSKEAVNPHPSSHLRQIHNPQSQGHVCVGRVFSW